MLAAIRLHRLAVCVVGAVIIVTDVVAAPCSDEKTSHVSAVVCVVAYRLCSSDLGLVYLPRREALIFARCCAVSGCRLACVSVLSLHAGHAQVP